MFKTISLVVAAALAAFSIAPAMASQRPSREGDMQSQRVFPQGFKQTLCGVRGPCIEAPTHSHPEVICEGRQPCKTKPPVEKPLLGRNVVPN
ncbi:hypothetical protein [Bradyrhizobium iriomotense]|uniref:hypothetical protein n=1 Tax=Bradyrhizobium iriomotense TaxID=441950 RepID=UPI0024E1050A|nr:hypothetical protein [Bradyrhizobium iriomotense]